LANNRYGNQKSTELYIKFTRNESIFLVEEEEKKFAILIILVQYTKPNSTDLYIEVKKS